MQNYTIVNSKSQVYNFVGRKYEHCEISIFNAIQSIVMQLSSVLKNSLRVSCYDQDQDNDFKIKIRHNTLKARQD